MIDFATLTSRDIGRPVVYHPTGEHGTITSWNHEFIYVRYGTNPQGNATSPQDLDYAIELHAPGIRKTPLCHCLQCGYRLNAGASPDQSGKLPGPGDVVVCMKCGAVMKYAGDMTVRGMSDAEMDELVNDPEWMNAIARVVQRIHFVKHAVG